MTTSPDGDHVRLADRLVEIRGRYGPDHEARAIMEVLGHSGISVTMNTYAHVLPALRQEAADAIDELFGA